MSTEQIQLLADELAIRNVVARFANVCSPPNYEMFAGLWVPDGQGATPALWTLTEPFPMSASGIEGITNMVKNLLETREFFVQMVHSGVVDITGDRASGRWIVQEVARGPGETYYNNYAIYEDVYQKVDGKWYFAERHYKYMFLNDSSFSGKSFTLTP
jgi:hypothetical protein